MKEFKKINNHFICEECDMLCNTKHGLGHHISSHHNLKQYMDLTIL
jgi:hypothetical protein